MKALIVAALALLALAGCAPESGTVRNKRIDVSCVGSPALCSTQPQLWISNSDQHSWPYTDRAAAGWLDVSQATYDRYRIGDQYP